MNHYYDNVDRKKTIQRAKIFLKEYHSWKIEAARFHQWASSSTESEMPKPVMAVSSSGQREKNAANASFECDMRVKTLEQLKTVDAKSEMLADLLYYRYINDWSVIKVASTLADKYDLGYMAERTYTNYLNNALWEFAVICPRDLLAYK